MSVCLLLIDDGRANYLERSLETLGGKADAEVVVEDPEHKLGFAGAIQHGWEQVLDTGCEWCFWVESDFTFNREPPVNQMVEALEAHPHLVQMALLRQPWNEQEKAAGGVVQLHPDDYEQRSWGEYRWLEHRRYVTTNPAVWPTRFFRAGWPQRSESEGHFGLTLFSSDPSLRSAYWGAGEEWVTHHGRRSGCGY